jgi:2'-5' RNA ligase
MRDTRYGFYLRPSADVSRAQAEIHDLLRRQFGLRVGGQFMPHATVKGFYKSSAPVEEMIARLDPVMAAHRPFPVYNAGPVKFGRKGIALDVQHMPDGRRNDALQAVHEGVLDVLLPLVAADCNFTWDDWVRERFHAHLTLAMADLPEFLMDEVYDFIRELGTVEPSVFTAESFHLYAFESDDWLGAWWETMSWRLLHSWRLAHE